MHPSSLEQNIIKKSCSKLLALITLLLARIFVGSSSQANFRSSTQMTYHFYYGGWWLKMIMTHLWQQPPLSTVECTSNQLARYLRIIKQQLIAELHHPQWILPKYLITRGRHHQTSWSGKLGILFNILLALSRVSRLLCFPFPESWSLSPPFVVSLPLASPSS